MTDFHIRFITPANTVNFQYCFLFICISWLVAKTDARSYYYPVITVIPGALCKSYVRVIVTAAVYEKIQSWKIKLLTTFELHWPKLHWKLARVKRGEALPSVRNALKQEYE
jgi:hypothetical protein